MPAEVVARTAEGIPRFVPRVIVKGRVTITPVPVAGELIAGLDAASP